MTTDHTQYIQPSPMLDFHHSSIQALIDKKGWRELAPYQRIGAVYHYVRDQIPFGYNADDSLTASQVLVDGYGQCNTKGTLLMALLRALGIATRIHGFTIDNELQRGAIPKYLFYFAPKKILHSWVEVYFRNKWINLEGYIVDQAYLNSIQQAFSQQGTVFSGYAIATPCLTNPVIDWQGQDTYIQREGIVDDFGIFSSPDEFYQQQGTNLSGIKKYFYRYGLRYLINANVSRIRCYGVKRR